LPETRRGRGSGRGAGREAFPGDSVSPDDCIHGNQAEIRPATGEKKGGNDSGKGKAIKKRAIGYAEGHISGGNVINEEESLKG